MSSKCPDLFSSLTALQVLNVNIRGILVVSILNDLLLPVLLADPKELVVLLLHLLLPLPVSNSHIIIVIVESDVSVAIFFNLLDDAFF